MSFLLLGGASVRTTNDFGRNRQVGDDLSCRLSG